MCGICCIFTNNTAESNSNRFQNLLKTYEACKAQLNRRGPDFQSVKNITIDNYSFLFAASVLWLQGNDIIGQPIVTENSIFLYNGNLYDEACMQGQNDTDLLLHLLENSKHIVDSLVKVQGPYAFIYLDKRSSKLYFGRDKFGRRSLLLGTKEDELLLTSVASKSTGFHCMEVPAIGIFCYDLHSKNFQLLPWKFKPSNFKLKLDELEVFIGNSICVNEANQIVDNTSLFVAPTESDLLCYQQVKLLGLGGLLKNEDWVQKVRTLEELLAQSVEKRIKTQPEFCINCIAKRQACSHTLSGVLFSGGVDCTILALLADDFTDADRPIDLLNVAFSSNAPDRLTGLESLDELRQLRPNRKWNFVKIDVTEQELNTERRRRIADLIYPRQTILDDSLGCALWFASQGQNSQYKSTCRVLLVGMGADELFGGYTKHRAALKQGGWAALHQSLEDDWQNISHRNLARDDRVVSDHGRQLCTPYLDENVVEFIRNLACWEKTCPSAELPQGLGEKILLRSLAYKMGLENAAYFKKRALQFGSRIANSKENANDVSPRL